MRRLLAHRDARIYLFGQALSIFGDSALWLAAAIWVKMLTGSNSAAGLTFFAFVCGSLLAPFSGMVADRLRRRQVLIWSNLSASAGICGLLLVDRHRIWLIYLIMFCYGAVGSLILSAQTALLTAMVPDDLLGDANTVLQLAEHGLRVVTPLVGAGLLAVIGAQPVILLDAATFLVAGLCVIALRIQESVPTSPRKSWRAEFAAGMRHISRTPALRQMMLAGVVALLAFGFFQTVPFAVVAQGLHRSPPFLGVLEAVLGVGALTGGALAGVLMNRTSERWLVAAGLIVSGLACVLVIPGWLPAVLAGMALVGACLVWVNVGAYTTIQRKTPPELIGRVDAALNLAVMIPQAVSIALGAALIAVVDYRVLLVAMAIVLAGSSLLLAGQSSVPAGKAADAAEDMTGNVSASPERGVAMTGSDDPA